MEVFLIFRWRNAAATAIKNIMEMLDNPVRKSNYECLDIQKF